MDRPLTYQLEFEDLSETATAVRADLSRRTQKRQKKRSVMIAVTVGVCGFVVMPFLMSASSRNRPAFFFYISLFLPLLLVAIASVGMAAIQFKGTRQGRKLLASLALQVVLWGFVGVMFYAIHRLQRASLPAYLQADEEPYDWVGVFLPHLTWAMLLVAMILLTLRHLRTQTRKVWDGQPSLHRPQTVSVTPEGLTFDDVVTRRQMRWLSFQRVLETKRVFVLMMGDVQFEMIPRRAFADNTEAQQFKALLDQKIRDPESPTAFDVIERPILLEEGAPLPVIPIESSEGG